MKKKLLSVTLAVLMCLAVTACGDKESKETVETTVATTVESTEESSVSEESAVAEETTTVEETEEASTDTLETAAEESTTEETGIEIKVEIPEGFTEVSEGMYMNPDYPNDGTNIIVMTAPVSSDEELPSEEAFKEQLVSALGDTEMEAEIEVEGYEKYQVSGYDAVRMTIKYSMNDEELAQTYVMVDADDVMSSVIYTAQGDAWNDAIEASIASITME